MTPNILRNLANSPRDLKAYFHLSEALSDGRVDPKSREAIDRVRAAGHDDEEIVEIAGNVAANIFTNCFNHVAQTEVEFLKVSLAATQTA